jgi:beta-galactosidase
MISQKLPYLLYGGDYNPDQWTEDVWKEDMRLFRKAGVNLVTLPVFSWAKLEPAEGVYEFGWLDRIMDLLAENGIYVCLATSTAAQPAWMSRKYPQMLPVDVDGRRRTHGKRVNFCPNSPDYRRLAADMARRLAARYKDHPALLLWHVANEYGTYCYCDTCAAAFREWVKKRYGTIEEVNRRWNLSFWDHTIYDWNEIVVPSELNDDNKWYQEIGLDYTRFMTESSLGCYLAEYRAIKEITPDVPVTTNISGFIKKLDQFRFAEYLDVVGWDNYPSPLDESSTVALKHDLMRSLKNGQPFLLVEQSPNQQNWQPYNRLKRPGEVRMLSWQAVAHGADSVMFFQMRQSRGGVEKFHGALISHEGSENTRVFRECAALGDELRRTGDSIPGSRCRAETAIVFDWSNWWAVELSTGPSRDLHYFEQVSQYYQAFYRRNIPVDFVRPDADLSSYKIVVLPLLYLLKDGCEKNFEAFVKNGGTAVASFFSGIVDENDNVTLGGYPGKLRKLFGVWVEETDALLPGRTNEILAEKGSGLPERSSCSLICDLAHAEGAHMLAVYGKDFYAGMPCVTKNSFGKGNAYYVATQPEPEFLQALLDRVCAEQGVRGILKTPEGVEATRRYRDGRAFTFLINHGGSDAEIPLDREYRSLLTAQPVSGTVTLKPFGVLVLESPC